MKKAVKKTVGRKVDEHTEEIKRYIGSVSEDFQHRVSAIGEQFAGLNSKLDSHAVMIARVMEDVEEIKSGMREKIDRVEFTKLEKRMVMLEAIVFGGKKK
jgi:hypothetical protein